MAGAHRGFIVKEHSQEWRSSPDPWRREVGRIKWKILVPVADAVSRDVSVGVGEIQPGGRIVLHHHPVAEIYYCISGSGRVEIDGDPHEIEAGDTVYIPAHAEHRLNNTGEEILRFLFVFPDHSHVEIPYSYLEEGVASGEEGPA